MRKNLSPFLLLALTSVATLGSLPSADVRDGRAVPVIDIHTHVFNADDLPIRGAIRTQYIKKVRVPDRIARKVALVLQTLAKPEIFDSAVPSKEQLDALLNEPRAPTLDPAERDELLNYVKANEVGTLPREFDAEIKAMGAEAELYLASRVLDLAGVFGPPDDDDHSPLSAEEKTEILVERKRSYLGLAKLLILRRMEISRRLTNVTYCKADMFVHHMMDMERAYGDSPELLFHEQVPLFRKIDGHTGGKLLRFVAYDPFRGNEGFDIVKKAWAEGAGGVKFYPSSGYRASGNEIPWPPSRWNWFARWERRRWWSAYGGTSNGQLNAQMKELFEWAAGANVPIFAHTDKADMSPNCSYWTNADPKYWKDYLETKETKALRLCFAHGGGDYYWTSNPENDGEKLKGGGDAAWKFGYDIVRFCRKYENVYLELGCLESVLEPKKHAAIIRRLTHDFAIKELGDAYWLGDKVMYGSDWTMLAQDPAHKAYLTQFDTIMRQVSGGAWHRKFFSGNAVKFLRLQERLDDTRLHEVQRNHWRTEIIPNSQPPPTPTPTAE